MYLPNSFAERDLPTLFAFMEAHPLVTLVTNSATGLFATHLPLIVDRAAGPMGTLFGHVARANPHSRYVAEGVDQALAIFTGPDAYITPEWYRTKQETGRVVPTWNYIAVHAYGTLRLRDDPSFLRPHLEALTRQHEGSRPKPWEISDAPADYIENQLKAIVGVEFAITRIEGKWKMSQNRTAADIDGVIHGLSESAGAQDQTVAEIVRERRPNGPPEPRSPSSGGR
jgi:transcriptional regulator